MEEGEVASNNTASGSFVDNPQPMVSKRKFAGKTVYDVDSDTYHKFSRGPKNKNRTFKSLIKDSQILSDMRKAKGDILVATRSSPMQYLRRK